MPRYLVLILKIFKIGRKMKGFISKFGRKGAPFFGRGLPHSASLICIRAYRARVESSPSISEPSTCSGSCSKTIIVTEHMLVLVLEMNIDFEHMFGLVLDIFFFKTSTLNGEHGELTLSNFLY